VSRVIGGRFDVTRHPCVSHARMMDTIVTQRLRRKMGASPHVALNFVNNCRVTARKHNSPHMKALCAFLLALATRTHSPASRLSHPFVVPDLCTFVFGPQAHCRAPSMSVSHRSRRLRRAGPPSQPRSGMHGCQHVPMWSTSEHHCSALHSLKPRGHVTHPLRW
jgi:hypothetical protein